jgi:hypothetical protein
MVGEIAKLVFEVGDSVLGRRYDKGGRATGEPVGATIVAIDGWSTPRECRWFPSSSRRGRTVPATST